SGGDGSSRRPVDAEDFRLISLEAEQLRSIVTEVFLAGVGVQLKMKYQRSVVSLPGQFIVECERIGTNQGEKAQLRALTELVDDGSSLHPIELEMRIVGHRLRLELHNKDEFC